MKLYNLSIISLFAAKICVDASEKTENIQTSEPVTRDNICRLIDSDALTYEGLHEANEGSSIVMNSVCSGDAPLIYAARNGKTLSVSALLAAGADINIQDNNGIFSSFVQNYI